MIIEILNFILTIFLYFAAIFTLMFFYNFIKITLENKPISNNKNGQRLSISENMRLVYAEKIKDILYLYDQATGVFIAQGKDEDELWTRAQERFPDLEFVLDSGELGNIKVVTFKTIGATDDNEKSL